MAKQLLVIILLSVSSYTVCFVTGSASAEGTSIAWFEQGNLHLQRKEYDDAIRSYSKVIEFYTYSAKAYNNRGMAYRAKREYDKAIEDYDMAIKLEPNDARAYNNRGNAYSDIGQFEKAIDDYSKAIDLGLYVAYKNREITYKAKGQPDKAINDFTMATKRQEAIKAGSTPSTTTDHASTWMTKVNANEVNMVTNRHEGVTQTEIVIDGKTYYGSCKGCAENMMDNTSTRFAHDPYTTKLVDKAEATIFTDSSGRVWYFESENSQASFIDLASKDTVYGYEEAK